MDMDTLSVLMLAVAVLVIGVGLYYVLCLCLELRSQMAEYRSRCPIRVDDNPCQEPARRDLRHQIPAQ